MSPEVLEIAEEGRRLFDEGQFRQAITLLDEGYEEHREPIFLQYIGRCYQELDEPCEAADYYHRFLAEGAPSAQVRQELEERSASLRGQCDAQTEEDPDPPTEPMGPPPTGPPRNFGGEPPPTPVNHRNTDVAGLTLMGLAGATLLAGVALWGVAYGMANVRDENGRDRCPSSGPCHPIAIAGDVLLFGATGALLTIGAVIFGVGRRRAHSQIAFAPGPGGFSLSLAWR